MLVEFGDGECRKIEVVSEKDEAFVGLRIEVTNASQLVGIMLPGVEAFEKNGLIALQSGRLVYGMRVETLEVKILLGTSHKESG